LRKYLSIYWFILISKNGSLLKQVKSFFGVPLSEKRKKEYRNPDNDPRGPWESKPWKAGSGQSGTRYKIISPTGKVFEEEWLGTEETFKKYLEQGIIYFPKGGDGLPRKKYYLYERLKEGQPAHNFWGHEEFGSNQEATKELEDLFGMTKVYSNPKPSRLISAISKISTLSDGILLDFFAGSGTPAHAVMKLNKEDGGKRKFILVEIADYFDTVIIPRIKKVAYSFNWKEGRPQDADGIGVFFKYHTLEQYEDALENIEFEQPQKTLYGLTDYFVKYMLEWETKGSKTFLNIDEMKDPFNYKLKIIENYQQKIVNVDLVETFNYLIGLNVGRYEVLQGNGMKYVFVFGDKDGKRIAVVWRSIKDIDFEKDREVIEGKLKEFEPDEIYINGEALVKGFRHIEPLFKSLMFEEGG